MPCISSKTTRRPTVANSFKQPTVGKVGTIFVVLGIVYLLAIALATGPFSSAPEEAPLAPLPPVQKGAYA